MLNRIARSRGWFRQSDDALLLLSATFDSDTESVCACGRSDVTSGDLTLSGVDCQSDTCDAPSLLSVPSSTAGSLLRLSATTSNSAATFVDRVVRACDASSDVPIRPAHVYSVRGTGDWMTASTCSDTLNVDTKLFVMKQSDTLCSSVTSDDCVAVNDNSLRGPTLCPNGGSELSWEVSRFLLLEVFSSFPQSTIFIIIV